MKGKILVKKFTPVAAMLMFLTILGSSITPGATAGVRPLVAPDITANTVKEFQLGGESIPTLFSTGVDDNGALLPPGAVDPHYTLVSSADSRFPGPATVVSLSNPWWVTTGPNSSWISVDKDFISMEQGIYIYRTTFDLTGFDPNSAVITGQYSVDNTMVDIRINSTSIGPVTPGDHYSFSSFTINMGFVEGINSIEFIVENEFGGGTNPTGLVVELSGSANRTAQQPPGVEKSYLESSLTADLFAKKAIMNNVSISGDFTGILNFTEFEIVTIVAGPFTGKGFSIGKWETTLGGNYYTGDWQGVICDSPGERRIYLKGAATGQISATVEGYLTESVPESGIYDKYQATWKIGRMTGSITSATINLTGNVSYQSSSEFPGTELFMLQTNIEGNVYGDYTGALNTILTQIRVAEQTNPYYGQGFSIISYTSETGSGEGWTYNKEISPGVIKLKGMFGSPFLGIASGTLDETITPRTLSVTIERIDLGLPPAPDLKVTTWGPTRVSPGQTVNYIIEYRNDGVKAADEVIVFNILDSPAEFISASSGANYDEFFHSVSWNLGKVLPKAAGFLSLQAEIPWGLSQGTTLGASAYIVDIEGSSGSPNLSVNGINLKFGSAGAAKCEEFARNQEAAWVPTYYTGYPVFAPPGFTSDVDNVIFATPGALDAPKELLIPTDYNGLTQPLITDHSYDTVYAYSGGTRTVLTAIRYYNLRCKKLVLISPMSGPQLPGTYKKELEELLQSKGVEEIEIYQSVKDTLFLGNLYQVKFDLDDPWLNGKNIKVNEIDLPGPAGRGAHWKLYLYVNDRLKGREGASSSAISVVATARDPNIKYGPEGNVSAGQELDYKVEYENEGEGIAFGVYFTDILDEDLDDTTLEIGPVISTIDGSVIAPPGTYDPGTRTITWFVGEVGSGEGGYAEFNVNVRGDAPDGTEIINFATVHFPSVPEATRTNGIVSVVGLNQPPVADADGPYVGDEGSPITFDASASSDPEGDALQYRWDLDNDGTWDTEWSDNPMASNVWDDDWTGTVSVEVSDGEFTDTATGDVVVQNVPPLVEAGPDQTVNEGDTVGLAPATFSDLGTLDSHTATIEWGDGSPVEAGAVAESDGSGTVSGSHAYAEDGTYTVEVCVTDDDGSTGCDTFQVTVLTVLNVPPSVKAGTDQTADEGNTVSLAPATFTDPEVDDTHTATIDWGDGSPVDAGTVSESDGSGTVSGSHVYGDDGTYTVTVTVCDDDDACGEDSFTVTVNNVAPAVYADPASQAVQYSDSIVDVTLTSTDVASDSLQLVATNWRVNGGEFIGGLPGDLALTDGSCSVSEDVNSCTWTLSGVADLVAGEYTLRVTVADEDGGQTDTDITLSVSPEDAEVAFDGNNPVAVQVDSPGSDTSQAFSLVVYVTETRPDQPEGSSAAGDISNAQVSMNLVPVGPGSPASVTCSPVEVTGDGYAGQLKATCDFDDLPVNTYSAEVTVEGGYYEGSGEDVLTVYDPSLGFATGGGWFYWPGTSERTNFGFTMKYNKKGENVKGNLLLIRHMPDDGSIYRVKSNALYGLALGESPDPIFGWASFSGKCTYLEPGWSEPGGNYEFLVYVEDRDEPDNGIDRFWIEVKDKDRDVVTVMSMEREATDNAVELQGGNIAVPHGGSGGGNK